MLIFRDEIFLAHRTPPGHPERPERYRAVLTALEDAGLLQAPHEVRSPRAATRAELERVHKPEYLDLVERLCASGGGQLDPDTHCVEGSLEAARRAAGAGIEAVGEVLAGRTRAAFCAVRPPGHHALPGRAMGFCLFANAAVAAAAALEAHQAERVLIVDWDLHHGNGTQEIFNADPRVFFFSMHRFPFWPGSGAAAESGAGEGKGFTLNLPLAAGTSRAEIRKRFREALAQIAGRFRPRLTIVSAGFDMHRADPLGGLSLEAEDYGEMTAEVAEQFLKDQAAGIVSCLEGGYGLDGLGACAAAHVSALAKL